MDLNHLNEKEIEKENSTQHSSFNNFISNFMKELSHSINNNRQNVQEAQKQDIDNFKKQIEEIRAKQHTPSVPFLEEDSIYVVNGIKDEEIGVVNIQNGDSFDIYVAINDHVRDTLNSNGIERNIYSMDKEDFYRLELGSNLIFQNDTLFPYDGEVEIENDTAWDKLEDLYFNLEQEESRTYQVSRITDSKIIMHDTENNSQYEVYRELYPDWEIGDIIVRENKAYKKQDM